MVHDVARLGFDTSETTTKLLGSAKAGASGPRYAALNAAAVVEPKAQKAARG